MAQQPYPDRAATITASERFLASESGRMLRSLGADLIIGAREGRRLRLRLAPLGDGDRGLLAPGR